MVHFVGDGMDIYRVMFKALIESNPSNDLLIPTKSLIDRKLESGAFSGSNKFIISDHDDA